VRYKKGENLMDLSSIIVSEKTVEIEFPGIDGFFVKLSYLSRDELMKIRKKCITMKFNKKTRQPEEEMDDAIFSQLYIERVIKGWRGLKFEHLKELLPLDDADKTPGVTPVDFSTKNADTLMKNSLAFDGWISEVIMDVSNFN
jgi:hypothetical protein